MMKNSKKTLLSVSLVMLVLALCLSIMSGCKSNPSTQESTPSSVISQTSETSQPVVEKSTEPQESDETEVSKTSIPEPSIPSGDLKFSEGFEFESNGDGTCTIIGIGTCTDKDIVIPEKSPDGDTVTLIKEYALTSLEDIDSVTLVNYKYKIDKSAFQYGKFKTLKIIGGTPKIDEYAFYSCEKLTSMEFKDCSIEVGKYALSSCGKDMNITFSNCIGSIDESAFQYSKSSNLTIDNSELEIGKYAFYSCEDLTSILFKDSTIEAGEYAFSSCGDSAKIEINNCSITFDDCAYQYSSLDSLTISGGNVKLGEYVFYSCEDMSNVKIDCNSVSMGKYAFSSCEDLISISICDNSKSDNEIKIKDSAFQYCDKLKSVNIGNGKVEIGKYVFYECSEDLAISIAGNSYNADSIEKGISL